MPEGRENDRVKYKWVTPKDLPDGNPPSDIAWISETGTEYTAQALLDLCQQMRLGRAADLYSSHATYLKVLLHPILTRTPTMPRRTTVSKSPRRRSLSTGSSAQIQT